MTTNLENTISAALLLGARVSALVMFAPLFGHAAVPMRTKAGLVVAVAALLYPVCRVNAWPVFSGGQWLWCLAGEMLIGLTIGLVMNLVFDGAQLAGQILGFQVGFSLVNVIDPQTQVDTPVLSLFHQIIVLLIFLQLDVHHWLLRGVANSYEYLPAGSVVIRGELVSVLWKGTGAVWLVGLQIAAPALVATVLADVALAFLAKASPQFPVMLFGISLKAIVGFVAMAAAMRYWPALMERYFGAAIATTAQLLRLSH